MDQEFSVPTKMSLSGPRSYRFSPMLSYRSVIDIGVGDPLWIVWRMYDMYLDSFFACRCSVVSALFVEKTVFSIVLPLLVCQRSLIIFICFFFSGLYPVHWYSFLFFHQCHTILITIALWLQPLEIQNLSLCLFLVFFKSPYNTTLTIEDIDKCMFC